MRCIMVCRDLLSYWYRSIYPFILMMTSSNGNIFRVIGPLCGEFTGDRWIPLTKTSDAELWCFLWSAPWINGWVNNREAGDLRRHRVHYDVIVMLQIALLARGQSLRVQRSTRKGVHGVELWYFLLYVVWTNCWTKNSFVVDLRRHVDRVT